MTLLTTRPRLSSFRPSLTSLRAYLRRRSRRPVVVRTHALGTRRLTSCLCREEQLLDPTFLAWTEPLHEARGQLHRKLWEWCFVCQALSERDLLHPGRTGLGFAVGQEPLVALFASRGVRVVATDLCTEQAAAQGWVDTNQHAEGCAALNSRGICEESAFRSLVDFQFADMNDIPESLGQDFDFVWSSCAMEHLGSIARGQRFVLNAMRHLRPGGIAIHTTEYNTSSNLQTLESGPTVLFRRRDILDLAKNLRREGHKIDLDFNPGQDPADNFIDLPPYVQATHLKLMIGNHVSTSIGIIIERGQA